MTSEHEIDPERPEKHNFRAK